MSDKLFDNEKKEYEYEDEDGILPTIKEIISKISSSTKDLLHRDEDEEEEEKEIHGSISLQNTEEEDEDNDWRDRLDRFTVIVVAIEIFLVVYFILALLGSVPFF